MKRLLLAVVLTASFGCAHAPANLTPQQQVVFTANQGVVAIGTVQHASIELNKIQICDPAPCHPLLSDANTKIVVDAVTDALTTLRATPQGWQGIVTVALDRIQLRLDAAGKQQIAAYISAARSFLVSMNGAQ
jgi:hypothetical protein